jgi:hypothetical protein
MDSLKGASMNVAHTRPNGSDASCLDALFLDRVTSRIVLLICAALLALCVWEFALDVFAS